MDKSLTVTSFVTTGFKCPCGKTSFQHPNPKDGDKVTCGFCGREFIFVIKIRMSKPDPKRAYNLPHMGLDN